MLWVGGSFPFSETLAGMGNHTHSVFHSRKIWEKTGDRRSRERGKLLKKFSPLSNFSYCCRSAVGAFAFELAHFNESLSKDGTSAYPDNNTP